MPLALSTYPVVLALHIMAVIAACVLLVGAGLAIAAAPAPAAAASSCPSPRAQARLNSAVSHAEARFNLEVTGSAVHTQLTRIAQDPTFLGALRTGRFAAALAEADRQLIDHVVRIRVSRGSRILVDANPTSFSVAGPALELRQHDGSALGQLRITIQDVLGFVKLVHKFTHAELLVRGGRGAFVTSLASLSHRTLPRSGCVSSGGRSYLVGSFGQRSFTGDPVTVWVLVPA